MILTEERSLGFDPHELTETELMAWLDSLTELREEQKKAFEQRRKEAAKRRSQNRRRGA